MASAGRTRSKQWRQIAIEADREPRTMYAIARAMGTTDGAVRSAFESMRADGLLKAKRDPNGNQIYAITPKGKRRLDKTDRGAQARRAMPEEARVLLIVDEGRSISPDLLAELAEEPTLAWSLRLDGIVRWMAVFESDDGVPVDRASARVEAAGARPIVGRADAIYNASELLAYAAKVATRRALPA
jgi:DNA-binding PadR family transcriptional regulator